MNSWCIFFLIIYFHFLLWVQKFVICYLDALPLPLSTWRISDFMTPKKRASGICMLNNIFALLKSAIFFSVFFHFFYSALEKRRLYWSTFDAVLFLRFSKECHLKLSVFARNQLCRNGADWQSSTAVSFCLQRSASFSLIPSACFHSTRWEGKNGDLSKRSCCRRQNKTETSFWISLF